MYRIATALRPIQDISKNTTPQHIRVPAVRAKVFSRYECATYSAMQNKGLENTTVEEVLKTKGEKDNSLFWCRTNDTVYDAVKQMTLNNIGSLAVLKPGKPNYIAGIITERDYLRKIIVQGRNSKSTKVGEIMTDENKLITVRPDTNILQAMQLMTGKLYIASTQIN
ncbi:hypothetical protein IFM89_007227 [Coptis chinensis]|uniref:CBS domain-containing protein n=1 Tax=Coptis chinensis TaxID=261450 RepID=A0A835MA69_9MAGN|nr:hypothetical protein IFM89_007227 [Coptis chinensis]